jgi:hypothetical protein
MAKLIELQCNKTYATRANAIKAAQAKFGWSDELRFIVYTTPEGRFFPVFLGEEALRAGVHFHFNIVN